MKETGDTQTGSIRPSTPSTISRQNLLFWLGAWTLFTILGIANKAQEPDLPSFRSLPTNLLNPWATWCPQHNGVVNGCFGTSWNHIGGPYSIFWYWFMIAVGLGGNISFTLGLFVLNLLFILFLFRRKRWVLIPYLPSSSVFLVGYPQNMVILWLEALGFWNPLFVALAVVVKLPFGAPLPVWQFMLTDPTSVRDPGNWSLYSILVVWGVVAGTWRFFLRNLVKRVTTRPLEPHASKHDGGHG